MKKSLAVALASSLLISTAQAPADWDLVRDPAKKSVMAFSSFDNGLSVAFRCVDGAFNSVLAGLPEPGAGNRGDRVTLRLLSGRRGLQFQLDPNHAGHRGGRGLPAPLAREFRQGGQLRLTVPEGAGDGRNLTYVVDLPSSNAAIDQALTACERPLVDPRDAELEAISNGASGLPPGVRWKDTPRPGYPTTRYSAGFTALTCITQADGRLRDCVLEMEHPHDGGFGREALRSTRRARLKNSEEAGAPIPVRRVSFMIRFRMA